MKNLPELARDAFARVIAAQKLAEGKFVYSVVLTDNVAHFATNKSNLNEQSKSFVTANVMKLLAENKNVYVEIQGHTDKTGSAEYNNVLGLKRAEEVRDYMASLGVPLHRMDVISYGEAKPISEKNSDNRRVVIQIMQ